MNTEAQLRSILRERKLIWPEDYERDSDGLRYLLDALDEERAATVRMSLAAELAAKVIESHVLSPGPIQRETLDRVTKAIQDARRRP